MEIEQLKIEINHIIDSGANDIRLIELFKRYSQPDADEKEIMMQAFDKVRKIFESRSWIMDGRGCYPYNDDRYKEEVRYLYDEFEEIKNDTWKNIKSKSFEYRNIIIEDYKKSLPPVEENKIFIDQFRPIFNDIRSWEVSISKACELINELYNKPKE